MKTFVIAALLHVSLFLTSSAMASPILWAHDSTGKLGTIDIATGNVAVIGEMGVVMTDIAFDSEGGLWGISFTDLYRINPQTAETTLIGSHHIQQGNALVFGSNGTLYGAGGGSFNLFSIDTQTGTASSLGTTGHLSAGDLAFYHGELYLSSTQSKLIRIDLNDNAHGTVVGDLGFSSVYGLATADNDTLYGISSSKIFSVDGTTGVGTEILNYGGQGLGYSYGSSFITESQSSPVPLPPTIILLGAFFPFLMVFRKRR